MAEFYFVPSLEAKMVNAARIDARKLLQPGVYITKYTATEVDVALWVQRARVDQYYESGLLNVIQTNLERVCPQGGQSNSMADQMFPLNLGLDKTRLAVTSHVRSVWLQLLRDESTIKPLTPQQFSEITILGGVLLRAKGHGESCVDKGNIQLDIILRKQDTYRDLVDQVIPSFLQHYLGPELDLGIRDKHDAMLLLKAIRDQREALTHQSICPTVSLGLAMFIEIPHNPGEWSRTDGVMCQFREWPEAEQLRLYQSILVKYWDQMPIFIGIYDLPHQNVCRINGYNEPHKWNMKHTDFLGDFHTSGAKRISCGVFQAVPQSWKVSYRNGSLSKLLPVPFVVVPDTVDSVMDRELDDDTDEDGLTPRTMREVYRREQRTMDPDTDSRLQSQQVQFDFKAAKNFAIFKEMLMGMISFGPGSTYGGHYFEHGRN